MTSVSPCRQQPFQHLLQRLGGQQAQSPGLGQPLVLPSAVQAASLVTGIATRFRHVVTPLPGQPSILHLFIDGGWRLSVDPKQITHDRGAAGGGRRHAQGAGRITPSGARS
ncbi:hypothetical protein ABT119_30545 [Streptomyces sp. NPDC001910]|uniref:hypothetical protein n=1 Tax=Streptomyces sp. NPDC001910 TaxID=3154403 RepID=UPI003329D826